METEWNIMRKIPAHTVSWAPTPAQAVIRPRFEMVEKASTFLPSLWEMAMIEAAKKVKPPIKTTTFPVAVFPMAGARRKRM